LIWVRYLSILIIGYLAIRVGRSAEDIYGLFFNSSVIQSFEEGKISPVEFFNQIKESLNLKIGFEEFKIIWNEIFFLNRDNNAVYSLTRLLHFRYTLALLSNINQLHFEYLKAKFPIFDCFHHLFLSYELGAVKPDPRIYQKALAVLKVSPQEAFYVDDRPELIYAASQIGIRSFVFKDYAQLIKDLADSDIRVGHED
jgi:FMN phosphatase YigB (HAD superfamily)